MSTQLQSIHFYRAGERVRHWGGREGSVVESLTLWATIRWDDGATEEVEQLDPAIAVTDRVFGGSTAVDED